MLKYIDLNVSGCHYTSITITVLVVNLYECFIVCFNTKLFRCMFVFKTL